MQIRILHSCLTAPGIKQQATAMTWAQIHHYPQHQRQMAAEAAAILRHHHQAVEAIQEEGQAAAVGAGL